MSVTARLWPSGLVGRVTLVLLAAILVEFVATAVIFGEAERLLVRSNQAQRIAEQLVVADRVLGPTRLADRNAVAARLSTEHVALAWSPEPGLGPASSPVAKIVEDVFNDWEPPLRRRDLRIRLEKGGWGGAKLSGALAMADGSWLRFHSHEPVARWKPTMELLASLLIVAAAVLAVAGLLVRTLGAPLRALANVADQIGFAHRTMELEPRGPGELKRLAGALNAMQARIRELIESRTNALVAVSHDLRTPLSRMKLRLLGRGQVDQSAMLDDVEEMEAMLASLLEFMRSGQNGGEVTRLNLASLVQTEVEREEDLGRTVSYDGPARVDVEGDPGALRRALVNLVENALKYGGAAELSLTVADGQAELAVRDHGPGMPPADLAVATTPFYRGDSARARDTKGLGLGLAIVTQVVERHGGTLALENVAGGGFRATMRLPLAAARPLIATQ